MSGALYVGRDELHDAIGEGSTTTLLAALGGQCVYVSTRPRRINRIVDAIGSAKAAELARFFETGIGGMEIELPSLSHRERVTAAISQGGMAGLSAPEIARQLGVHPRTVRRARADLRARRPRASDPDNCPGHVSR